MVFAVTDSTGEVLGLYRMPDATVFSIDVAVAKARNVAYYDDPAQLTADRPACRACPRASRSRTARSATWPMPRFPSGIDGTPPGPFSILNDGGVDRRTGLQVGAALPASRVPDVGDGLRRLQPRHELPRPDDAGQPERHRLLPRQLRLYKRAAALVGGFGVSGDGVDQDDVVTHFGIMGYAPPSRLRVDHFFVSGVRLPYLKFPRNPER